MSLYGPEAGGDGGGGGDVMVCGRALQPQSVGQAPAGQPVKCQNQGFELIVVGAKDTHGQTPIKTHCIVCHNEDPMSLLMTNADGTGNFFSASQVPQLLQQGAQAGMIVCAGCYGYRFRLHDRGNELYVTCLNPQCRAHKHLGYQSQAHQQHQRSFGQQPSS